MLATLAWGSGDRSIPGTHWSASQAQKMSSRFQGRGPASKTRWMDFHMYVSTYTYVPGHIGAYKRAHHSTHVHRYTYAPEHIGAYRHVHFPTHTPPPMHTHMRAHTCVYTYSMRAHPHTCTPQVHTPDCPLPLMLQAFLCRGW